jgi:amidase
VGQAEFKPQFERYLKTLAAGQPHTLAQLIAISESSAVADSQTPVNPARLAALRDADVTQLTDSPTYIHILTQTIPSLRHQLQALMAADDLQALVFSTMSCPAGPRFDTADPTYVCHADDSYKPSYIAAAVGFPEITVPAGKISGNLPAGFSFMALPYHEAQLLVLGNAFERAAPRQPVPQLSF